MKLIARCLLALFLLSLGWFTGCAEGGGTEGGNPGVASGSSADEGDAAPAFEATPSPDAQLKLEKQQGGEEETYEE